MIPLSIAAILITIYFLTTSEERTYKNILFSALKLTVWVLVNIMKIFMHILRFVVEECTPYLVYFLILIFLFYALLKVLVSVEDAEMLERSFFIIGDEISYAFLSLAGALAFYDVLERRKRERKKERETKMI